MFPAAARPLALLRLLLPLTGLALLPGCSHTPPPPPAKVKAPPPLALPRLPPPPAIELERVFPVMPGIDVLEAGGFAPLRGKRVGLLTHPAGVHRRGESTIEVLRHAPGVNLVALYGVEHGLYGKLPASQIYPDGIDTVTGLPLYSLFNGKDHKPTSRQLKSIDVLVIDLQDIGSRSYTFISAMKVAMEACFENGKEVIVLDRPNPLGGLKVDGPPMDPGLMSYVGNFGVPYVHGLTIGELANLAQQTPGVLAVSESVRRRGRLTVVPMRGWHRSMRWPDTGLTFVPTSPYVKDYAAAVGYAMTGLGCQLGGFTHGLGTAYPFRALYFPKKSPEELQHALEALHLPGVAFRVLSAPGSDGKPMRRVYVDITDWNACRPTELSFYLLRFAAAWNPRNPFATAGSKDASSFNHHVGSSAWWQAIKHDGAQVNVAVFVEDWHLRAEAFQRNVRHFWLYPP